MKEVLITDRELNELMSGPGAPAEDCYAPGGNGPLPEDVMLEWQRINDRLREIEEEDRLLRDRAAGMLDTYGYLPDRADDASGAAAWRDRSLPGMDISFSGGVLAIRVPEILPHRKSRPDTAFYADFRALLEGYARENPAVLGEIRDMTEGGIVLTVVHSYRTRSMVRDSDNTELKPLIDALSSLGFIDGDRGEYMDMFLTSAVSPGAEKNSTRILIMPKERFWKTGGNLP